MTSPESDRPTDLLLYLGQHGGVTDGRTDVVTVGQLLVTHLLTAGTPAKVTAMRQARLVVTVWGLSAR